MPVSGLAHRLLDVRLSCSIGASPEIRGGSSSRLDLSNARIVWEATDRDPVIAREFEFTIPETGEFWIEAEAQWPDGRRAFAVLEKAQ